MKTRITIGIVIIIMFAQITQAAMRVKIISLSGEVKVRRGVEETWHTATIGMLLEEIDTILTGKGATVMLEIFDKEIFKIGSNAFLDIGDLRKISEKELFLFLMSNKVNKIEPRKQKTQLRVGNVSVIHGESKADSESTSIEERVNEDKWVQELNGAKDLYQGEYYSNAIVKLVKILAKYSNIQDCGKINFYLGKSFEAINKNGQAIDAYQAVIDRQKNQDCENVDAKTWLNESQKAIERLRNLTGDEK